VLGFHGDSDAVASRQTNSSGVDFKAEMSRFFSNKAVRLLLTVSVSIWMAGGCLFGCTTGAMGAEPADEAAVVAGASCHAMPSHDCCDTTKPKKQTTSNLKLLEGVASFIPAPRGMMKDCPLGVNATAATTKGGIYLPEPARGPVAALPAFEKPPLQTEYPQVVPFLHNRGSTHLQCCVFLI
jgi:hypothetical protein